MGTLKASWQMIIGQRSTDELGGPLRIAQMSGEVAQGGIAALLYFMAVLSVNLGLINLFPIPVLDGGHLLFYVAEALRGKPLGQRAQEYGFRVGLALVLSLMVLVSAADGKLSDKETRTMVETFAGDPVFENVTPERAMSFVSEAVTALSTEGLAQRLTVLAAGLATRAQRLKAFRLGARMASAAKDSRPHAKILDLLQATFGIADDEVEKIRKEVGLSDQR